MSWLAPRYTTLWLAVLGTAGFGLLAADDADWGIPALIFAALLALGIFDLLQRKHAIRRNYPILGNLRFLFEFIRPELRQYFFEDDTKAAPFSRNQRSIVYQRAKQDIDKRPFGTQEDVYERRYEWINHSMAPVHIENFDFRVTVGGPDCTQPYSASIFNISAMSFGALSANAVTALNTGARKGNFAHDTGEGGISRYHRAPGGDLVWNIGSGYFGCRDADGHFSEEAFVANATSPQVRMIEIKLSQGAKPGHGGILPGAKVTSEIAEARGVLVGVDCNSPSRHGAFSTPIGLMQFVARLRRLSGGKPVGFKLCVGHPWEWFAIVKAMLQTGITPDFIVVDGAEGGTGAAPVEFTDHVGVPLQDGLLLVHNTLVGVNLRDRIRIGASGKIITAFDIARTLALGADWCNSARGFMFSLGCIQAQACHTDRCPTGVTTQDPLRQKALVVPDKAERVYSFHRNTLRALSELVSAAGMDHPSKLSAEHIVRRISGNEVKLLASLFPFLKRGELLAGTPPYEVYRKYWPMAQAESFEAMLPQTQAAS
ncbi:FMN-binding glutamate synthase family protein [Pigmentiphaga sp.]|uniref:FMN-binding glutamate synthase family protein n=1 Tax=Pigmentiphaga sp. TaxID=1977564 RepID=UPI00128E7627|nr:FMN-binding glutamate synthase family protein [Pigmentiphaga sp.]MPS29058.1 FMN-binding glutamate synthase family protein [Alcaligenaceae bacterium SAGV5]MPS52774.1 FMN-binding glutamate synthase family protein [Alcaligenaceae bacterium SAGV3]MPT59994.1 FMN-binding glutamate synthase family protein [Alcaligenaceae bacterium]